mmetsp:Transcript_2587/g.3681  ORF Transcript_2587/g.3681 Transcript_2587/m.3681 type:complete len:888 (-) Transcript_2587:496-3159(-)
MTFPMIRIPVIFMFIFSLLFKISCFLCCSNFDEISVFLPRNHMTVTADITFLDERMVAVVGGMILGEVVCEEVWGENGLSYIQYVELQGDFDPLPPLLHDQSSSNDRTLEVMATADKRWPNSVIYYHIKDGFSSPMVDAIHNAAWIWTHNSPMRFIESSTAKDRIEVTPFDDARCAAVLGRKGGTQLMGLEAIGQCNLGRIIHEFGHAIGWDHEHVRPDRAKYITVKDENILLGYEDSYAMVHDGHYGAHRYDYGSVMHYPPLGFAVGDENIIEVVEKEFKSFKESYPNELPKGSIGQRFFLSTIDKQMSYTYLTGCFDDRSSGQAEEPSWVSAPWGGCNPQCNGPSFRERLVSCRLNGECRPEPACNHTAKPPTRQSCELAPGNLNVTFDESSWWEVGSMMQNVPMYDQYEWNIWSGNPAEITTSGEQYTGERTEGPGGDASESGEGRYLWFSSWNPLKEGDEAWYESPVVTTTNDDPCEISFHYFIAGRSAKLKLELVSCDDCWDRTVVWSSSKRDTEWMQITVQLPVIDDMEVRARFVGQRGEHQDGNIGLDSIAFSEGCVRPNIDEIVASLEINDPADIMEFPYELDPYCTYVNPGGFTWTLLYIFLVGGAGGVCIIFSCSIGECILRKRRLKKIIAGEGKASMHDVKSAVQILKQMNPRKMSSMIQQETMRRVGSVREVAPSAASHFTQNVRDSFRMPDSVPEEYGFHRNKSSIALGVPHAKEGIRRKSRFSASMKNVLDFVEDTGAVSRLQSMTNVFKIVVNRRSSQTKDSESVYRMDVSRGSIVTDISPSSVPTRGLGPEGDSAIILSEQGINGWLDDIFALSAPIQEGAPEGKRNSVVIRSEQGMNNWLDGTFNENLDQSQQGIDNNRLGSRRKVQFDL